jgi:hypothetical protein
LSEAFDSSTYGSSAIARIPPLRLPRRARIRGA